MVSRSSGFNTGIFLYIAGSNVLLLGLAFLLSGIVSIYYGETQAWFLIVSFAVSVLLGGFLVYRNRNFVPQISKKDGRLIVGLMWLLIPILGALPFAFDTRHFGLIEALFESFSGYTTTGASVVDDVESLSKGLLFYRSFTQWIGGLGFAFLVIVFVRDFPDGAKNLFNAEFNSIEKEKDRPHIKNTVFKLFVIYSVFTIACFVLLNLGEMNSFEAICHTFSTISTGGFTVSNNNIGTYGNYSQIVIMVFMFLSGISYFLMISFLNGKFKKLFKDEQLRMYIRVILFFSIGFCMYFLLSGQSDVRNSIRTSLFYVISTVSSTGFDLKANNIGLFASACMIVLMFIGGCSASSSTGLKMIRFTILLKYIPVALKRVFHPRAIILVRYNGKGLRDEEVKPIFGFFFLFLAIFMIGIIALTMAGNDLVSSLALSAASISNIGPIMGTFAEGFSYGGLNVASKSILIALMLIGRLEIFAFFAVFSPSVWKRG